MTVGGGRLECEWGQELWILDDKSKSNESVQFRVDRNDRRLLGDRGLAHWAVERMEMFRLCS